MTTSPGTTATDSTDRGLVVTLRCADGAHRGSAAAGPHAAPTLAAAAAVADFTPPALVPWLARMSRTPTPPQREATGEAAEWSEGVSLRVMEDAVLDQGGVGGLAECFAWLSALEGAARIGYEVRRQTSTYARFLPAAYGRVAIDSPPPEPVVLSRFAHLRRDNNTLILDSPIARGKLQILHSHAALVIASLSAPATCDKLIARTGVDDEPWVRDLLVLLLATGMAHVVGSDGLTDEDRSPASSHWEFADLLLHARSKTSRVDEPVGGTYRFPGVEQPTLVKPPMCDDQRRIALRVPNIGQLIHQDVPLARAMETRRSIRHQGDEPIDVGQLGEFLYRVARMRDEGTPYSSGARWRLYPGGGACHPLEIYALASRCRGLDPGLYHYDPAAHALEPVDDPLDGVAHLLQQNSVPMEGSEPTQILLVITSRFRRMSWKYEGNAYALTLQEVGVLYQSMYLVATAMGLAPCAVGGGDAARFAEIIGADPLEEATVGAFTLGSRHPDA